MYPEVRPRPALGARRRPHPKKGGEIHMGWKVDASTSHVAAHPCRLQSTPSMHTGDCAHHSGDYFFSTMPMRELIRAIDVAVPAKCSKHRRRPALPRLHHRRPARRPPEGQRARWRPAEGHLDLHSGARCAGRPPADLQQLEPVPGQRSRKVWIGLEYFCYDTDDLWKMPDDESEAVRHRRGREDRHSRSARRQRRARGSRAQRPIRPTSARTTASTSSIDFTDRIENLFLVGRNGMHKYNNQDHCMLTAMHAVDRHRGRQDRQDSAVGDQHRAGIPRRKKVAAAGLRPEEQPILTPTAWYAGAATSRLERQHAETAPVHSSPGPFPCSHTPVCCPSGPWRDTPQPVPSRMPFPEPNAPGIRPSRSPTLPQPPR